MSSASCVVAVDDATMTWLRPVNTTTSTDRGDERMRVALATVAVAAIIITIVLGNTLVIVAIAADRRLKGVQNWFIASLAVSDLLVGLFIMPLSLANELMGYWAFGDILCQLWLSTDVLLCTASILNLCLISLDRYWSITRAISYLRKRTPRRAALMISVVWIASGVICFPPLAGWSRADELGGRGLSRSSTAGRCVSSARSPGTCCTPSSGRSTYRWSSWWSSTSRSTWRRGGALDVTLKVPADVGAAVSSCSRRRGSVHSRPASATATPSG